MKLALFDIDGTLTRTNGVDGRCFEQALADAFGITDINTDWSSYPHTCDSSILRELFRERFRRDPDVDDVAVFKRTFMGLLEDCLRHEPESFQEVPGAAKMIATRSRAPGWGIAVATGAWRESGALKLRAAGIRVDGIACASADDGYSREEIVKKATARALDCYTCSNFERIISIGDAIWDFRTANNLGMAFVGVAGDGSAVALREAKVTNVIADFDDYDQFFEMLMNA